jgi:ligand-binding SRPBCC domain-containing protein
MPAPASAVYAFHARPDALVRLIPPWERVRVLVAPTSLAAGTRVVLRQWIGVVPVTIESIHTACEPGVIFVDQMVRGPFQSWVHEHRFERTSDAASWLVDDVEYSLPLEPLSDVVRSWVRGRVERMFAFRHDVTLAAMKEATAAR